ncbi:ATP-binding protein [Paenibacillus popilliae]|nr:ATP-binding protein [Paenibacillus popilliae]
MHWRFILDRILHHSGTDHINGESYRIKDKKKAVFLRPDSIGDAEAER